MGHDEIVGCLASLQLRQVLGLPQRFGVQIYSLYVSIRIDRAGLNHHGVPNHSAMQVRLLAASASVDLEDLLQVLLVAVFEVWQRNQGWFVLRGRCDLNVGGRLRQGVFAI